MSVITVLISEQLSYNWPQAPLVKNVLVNSIDLNKRLYPSKFYVVSLMIQLSSWSELVSEDVRFECTKKHLHSIAQSVSGREAAFPANSNLKPLV